MANRRMPKRKQLSPVETQGCSVHREETRTSKYFRKQGQKSISIRSISQVLHKKWMKKAICKVADIAEQGN
jgi:hypothetical protein